MLGLPDAVTACLFDMDGVLTRTAKLHAAAWKETCDAFLCDIDGESFTPFDPVADYVKYVDGKKREDGTRSFLESRGIDLPEGDENDPPDARTVHGLSARKNQLVLKRLREGGVEVYDDSLRYVHAARAAGLGTAVVSSSANTAEILTSAGIADLFDARVDGLTAQERGLAGKPAPDMFLAGAEALGVPPSRAAVFEDALAGVRAGQAGSFAFVVGIDRTGQADALREHGATVVVKDLDELLKETR